MNSYQLMEGIGEIDSRFLQEADDYQNKSTHRAPIRWLSLAACLAIAVSAGVLYTKWSGIPAENNSAMTADMAAPDDNAVSQNAAEAAPFSAKMADDAPLYLADGIAYALVSTPAVLEQNGLPDTVSEDAVGEVIAVLDDDIKICTYLPLEDVPAIRVLSKTDMQPQFLFYQGQATEYSLGTLYGFSAAEDIDQISVNDQPLSTEDIAQIAESLAELKPDLAFTPEETTPDNIIQIRLQNGLTFQLSFAEFGTVLKLFDLYYPAEDILATLLHESE